MGLLGFVKSAVNVVTTPFAAAGGLLGNVGGIALDGAGQFLYHAGEDVVHAATFGKVGSWANPFSFDTKQLFMAGALGSKLGEFAGGFGAKFLLPGGLLTGLLFGGLSLSNGFVDKDVLSPVLMQEAKVFGLMGDSAGNQAGNGAVQFAAICGPNGTAPDGTPIEAVAVPLPAGAQATGPVKTDPSTGQRYQLVVVPAGACTKPDGSPSAVGDRGVVTVTPQQLSQTKGMASALDQASSGN